MDVPYAANNAAQALALVRTLCDVLSDLLLLLPIVAASNPAFSYVQAAAHDPSERVLGLLGPGSPAAGLPRGLACDLLTRTLRVLGHGPLARACAREAEAAVLVSVDEWKLEDK